MGRNKKSYERKRKKISTTIDKDLWLIFEDYAKLEGNKSRLLEKIIIDGLKNNDVIKKLNENGIILPNSDLIV